MTARVTLVALLAAALACNSGAGTPYGPCASSSACADATPRCITFRNRATGVNVPLCTAPCATNAECPNDGVCVPIVSGGFTMLCMQRCQRDADCPFSDGFCPLVRAGDMACVP